MAVQLTLVRTAETFPDIFGSRFGLAVTREAAKRADRVRVRFILPFSSTVAVYGHSLAPFSPTINDTLKCPDYAAHLNAVSFWW